MAYTPTAWSDGDLITADRLNHIEAALGGGLMLVIGDSWSAGVGASDDGHQWTTLLAGRLGLTERNMAVASQGWATGGQNYTKQIDQAIAATDIDPDTVRLVRVTGGINDNGKDTSEPMTAGLVKLRAAYPQARVATIADSYNPLPDPVMEPAWKHAAWATGCDYLGYLGYLFARDYAEYATLIHQDGQSADHPTDKGHELIAGWAHARLSGASDTTCETMNLTMDDTGETLDSGSRMTLMTSPNLVSLTVYLKAKASVEKGTYPLTGESGWFGQAGTVPAWKPYGGGAPRSTALYNTSDLSKPVATLQAGTGAWTVTLTEKLWANNRLTANGPVLYPFSDIRNGW